MAVRGDACCPSAGKFSGRLWGVSRGRRQGSLLDGDLPGGTTTCVGQDAHVFEADEMGDDLDRIDVHRGVEDLLFHTLRLKRLCAYAVDPR